MAQKSMIEKECKAKEFQLLNKILIKALMNLNHQILIFQ